MTSDESRRDFESLQDSIRRLEERIARLETHFGIEERAAEQAQPEVVSTRREGEEEDLEFEVGQNWFAKAGIIVLAIGMAFVLTFPYSGLPSFLPSLFGYVLAAGMIGVSSLWRSSYQLISRYLFGAGLALFYFATLRLFFFSTDPPLVPESLPGILLLGVIASAILFVSIRRESTYLTGLALAYAFGALLVIGIPAVVFAGSTALAALVMTMHRKWNPNPLLLLGITLALLTHLVWAIGNPVRGNPVAFVASPWINIISPLVYSGFFAMAALRRENRESESLGIIIASGLNAMGSYGLFLLLTVAAFQEGFVLAHLLAAALFLTIAVLFWTREHSRFSTFIYSMFGYMAISVALLKAFGSPEVFVWLSLQSILVLSTAIWFRSRFIVVANFIIYLSIITGYLVVTEGENGMSIGFGVVALVSARILNWQKDRLELKTEMMRNAYLATAFCAFPYALSYLMPQGTVSLSWVGIALFYYLMSSLIRKQKYRWMGHLTLGLTVLYVMVIGIIQLDETLRILSFLVLGVVLIVVSIVFTKLRGRRKAE